MEELADIAGLSTEGFSGTGKAVADQLEIIPPQMIVHRITGDGPIDLMIGPMWSVNKWEVLNGIDAELKNRDSWQGKFFKKEEVTTR